jgi:hypothetical protein
MWNVCSTLARNLTRFDGRDDSTHIVSYAQDIYDQALSRSQNQAECVGWIVILTRQHLHTVSAIPGGQMNYNVIEDLSKRLIASCLEGI